MRALLLLVTAVGSLSAQQPSPAAPPTLAQVTLDLVPAIRTGTTLGAWRRAHPADSVLASTGNDPDQCALAMATVALPNGYRATRTTYFYLPPTPDNPGLPAGVTPAQLRDRCRAAEIRIKVDDIGTTHAAALKSEVERALTTTLGPADTIARSGQFGPHMWRERMYREVDRAGVITAFYRNTVAPDNRSADTVERILVAITTPGSALSPRRVAPPRNELDDAIEGTIYDADTDAASRRQTAMIDEAFGIAAMGGATESTLRAAAARVLSVPDPLSRQQSAEAGTFVDALEQWLKAGNALPAPRRAAALYVADGLLERSMLGDDTADTPLRHRLLAAGAEIPYHGDEDAGYMYGGNWLNEALQIFPGSRAGEMAFLRLAETGFGYGSGLRCGAIFRMVIARGEQYLQRFPASPIRGTIHLLMGAAWGDVVALADEEDDGIVSAEERVRMRREAPMARAHAIAEFAAAFRQSPDSAQAHALWPDAFRLMAGLAPVRTYFYCIPD